MDLPILEYLVSAGVLQCPQRGVAKRDAFASRDVLTKRERAVTTLLQAFRVGIRSVSQDRA